MSGRIVKRKESGISAIGVPEIGKVKIGEKKMSAGGKEYPSATDYFIAKGAFEKQFKDQFGEKPDKLLIVFISDDFNQSCQERFECWDKGKRMGWGDGENFTVWDDVKKDYVEVDKDSKLLANKKWDEMVTLRFLLPELRGVIGHWSFTTKGKKTTIPAIVSAFDFIQQRMGTVVGVPFELIVSKAKGYSPGEARQYSKVTLVPNISQAYMMKVREELAAGRSMNDIAPLMVSEAKLLSEDDKKALPAFDVAVEVEETVEPIKSEAPPTTKMQPNPDLFNENK